jgi:hypothetical protein
MSHLHARVLVLAGALWAALPLEQARAAAQPPPGGAPAQPGGAAGAQATSRDERAIAPLKEMSKALSSAKTLRFKTRSLLPFKLASGEWVTLVGSASVMRQGKEKLFVETGGDLFHYRLYFDGKAVTAFAPKEKMYAEKPAPGTIDEMLQQAARRGEASFLFSDLLTSDPYTEMADGLEKATIVGTSVVDGVETQHVAVVAKDLDWEAWIGAKDRLPRMVTLTDKRDARKPTHTVMFSDWAVDAKLPADAFTFRPPTGSTRVPFRDPAESSAGAGAAAPGAVGGAGTTEGNRGTR